MNELSTQKAQIFMKEIGINAGKALRKES